MVTKLRLYFLLFLIIPILLSAQTISVAQFGAKGDGKTDDRAAIQKALDSGKPGNSTIYFPKGIYLLKGGLVVSSSQTLTAERGATLQPFGIFTVLRLANGSITIEGLTIDAKNQINGSGMTGIQIDPRVNATISNCNLINWSHGTGIRYYGPNNEPYENIVIQGSKISGADPVSKNISPVRWYAVSVERVSKNLTSAANTATGKLFISDNAITGGYYGINLIGVSNATVKKNTVSNVMRGISLQRKSSSNLIQSNQILNCRSSGILIGYNSNDNIVKKNNISSRNWVAEALIKINVSCDRNLITKNRLESLNKDKPGENFLNISLMSNDNIFEKNVLIGMSRKPPIAIESAWNNKTKDPDQFGYGKSVALDHLAKGSISGVTLFKNDLRQVTRARENQAYIYISEGSSKSSFKVNKVELKRNKLPNSSTQDLSIKHNNGSKARDKSINLE